MRDATGNRWVRGWRLIPILFCLLMICQSAFAATKPSGALKDVEAATQDAEHGIYTLYPGMPLEEYLYNWGNIKGWTTLYETHGHQKKDVPMDKYTLGKSRDHDHVTFVQTEFLNKKMKFGEIEFYFRSAREAEKAFEIASQNFQKAFKKPTLKDDDWNQSSSKRRSKVERWLEYDKGGAYNLLLEGNYRVNLIAEGNTTAVEHKGPPLEELSKKLPYRIKILVKSSTEEELHKEYDAYNAYLKRKADKKTKAPTNRKTTSHKIH